ncbi:MAG: thioredoxin [Planctomycetaceae bacterium]|nr:thioredoxin [Planctomycetaceae bacterium]
MSHVSHVTLEEFNQVVLGSPVPVLVDFYADWCGPCRMLAPVLERLAAEFNGRARIVKVNVDTEPELAEHYSVEAIPTLLFVVDGEPIGRTAGMLPETALHQALTDLTGPAVPNRQRVG